MISRTDVRDARYPLVVVWMGPLLGSLAPLAFWGVVSATGLPGAFVARFFAGFCLLANGGYLAFGSFDGVGDCGTLLAHGAPIWSLWLFGAVTMPCGLFLWHGLGSHFSLGKTPKPIDRRVSLALALTTFALVVLGLATGR